MNVQWYPGHMTKAKRQMQEDIKLIDLIIELVDARVPLSSRNPDIDELGKNKSRLILLNKSDLADERQNEAWKTYFQAKGFYVVKVDSRNGSGMKAINNVIQEACKEKIERDRRRGIKNRPIRAMVVGIPNVGKSTFINTFAGRACAKTGNKPGVTKGKQWIRLNKGVEALAARNGIRVSYICAVNTSRLAFDGSGKVLRGKDAGFNTYELCKFTTGKVYNCDLSASKNIGARFFIRVLLKSLSAKEELLVLAKVPELNRRTSCCLATLINAYAVLCASKAKPEASAEGNAARQSH